MNQKGAPQKQSLNVKTTPNFTFIQPKGSQRNNMEKKVNQDTGLTPQEEEELLAIDEGGEVVIDEGDEALLNEWGSPCPGLNYKEIVNVDGGSKEFTVNIAKAMNKDASCKENEPRTSTPLKHPGSLESSTSGEASPSGDRGGLGGFKIPRTTTVLRSKTPRKRPDPGPEIEIIAELKTEPKRKGLKKPKLEQKVPTASEEEVEVLEEGEIPSVEERTSSKESGKMGNQASLPRILRAVVDVLEDGEIESPQQETGPKQPPEGGDASQTGEETGRGRTWRKNGGQGVKGRNAPLCSRRGSTTRPSNHQEFRNRPLSPFRERSVQSLPDVEKIVCAGRPYHWRERGGSMTRGSRVTPKDFRPGFHPKKKELRSDGIVSQRENARARERLERQERQKKEHQARANKPREEKLERAGPAGKKDQVTTHDRQREVREALNELEEAGAKYQKMLAAFAAKYQIEEGPTPPKKTKRIEGSTEVGEAGPGPSRGELTVGGRRTEGEVEQGNVTVELSRGDVEMGDDEDAVEVREAEPEEGIPAPGAPVFTFSPPIPVQGLPQYHDDSENMQTQRSEEPEVPPRSHEIQRAEESPQVVAMIPGRQEPEQQPLQDPLRPEGPRPGVPRRYAGPRLDRVQAPAPDLLNQQGGRIGPPGTGSRSTRERRWRRERAQRLSEGLRKEL